MITFLSHFSEMMQVVVVMMMMADDSNVDRLLSNVTGPNYFIISQKTSKASLFTLIALFHA